MGDRSVTVRRLFSECSAIVGRLLFYKKKHVLKKTFDREHVLRFFANSVNSSICCHSAHHFILERPKSFELCPICFLFCLSCYYEVNFVLIKAKNVPITPYSLIINAEQF